MKESVLILTGAYGDGHLQAANAIRESLLRMHPGVQADVTDYMELTHPHAHQVYRYMYLQGVRKLPSMYRFLFDHSREINPFSNALKKMNRFGVSNLLSLIQKQRPAVVISTFPFAAGAMSALRESGATHVPAVTVITDHTCHSSWIYPSTDRYFVGSDYVRQGLLKHGVPTAQCTVTGIPIRADFTYTYDRERISRKLGLDPSQQTLMIMGGGYGMMDDVQAFFKALNDLPQRIQMVFVCGRNKKMETSLQQEAAQSKHSIRILGYVKEIHEWMAASDLMVTKPGGLTISEALAMNLPMVVYNAIPGQEEDNAQFLLQAGAALKADSMQELVQRVSGLLQSPARLRAMRKRAQTVQKKDAADAVAGMIMKTRFDYDLVPSAREAWLPTLQT